MKINILAQIHAHIEQASWLRIYVPTLKPTVKNCEEIGRLIFQCGPSSKQQKALKCSPLEINTCK
jgi:hypothetical protein